MKPWKHGIGWLLVGQLLALLFVPLVATAHESRPAYLAINETAPGQFSVLWRTPVLAGMRLPIILKLPGRVKNLDDPVVSELATRSSNVAGSTRGRADWRGTASNSRACN